MLLEKPYEIISVDNEKELLFKELLETEIFFFNTPARSELSEHENIKNKKVIYTRLDPHLGLMDLIEKFPNVFTDFDVWVLDGWESANILGVNNQLLEVPDARVMILGTNFYGVEVLRTELTFTEIEKIDYPDSVSKEIEKVLEEWNFEMIRRKTKTLALGLYHFFEK